MRWTPESRSVQDDAQTRLKRFVRLLTRARWRQLFVKDVSNSLLVALFASSLVVLYLRLTYASQYIPITLLTLFGFTFLVTCLHTWTKRPDPLDVAIRADLKLKLSQKLSTAYEISSSAQDERVADRLALQALRARLPARPGYIFASQFGFFAPLFFIALVALVLVSTVDLRWVNKPEIAVDNDVVNEGTRLREFAHELNALARREALRRSERQSRTVQELATRMESGGVSRKEAMSSLSRLRATLDLERIAALGDSNEIAASILGSEAITGSGVSEHAQLRSLVQAMLDGRITLEEARGMLDGNRDWTNAGVSPFAMQRALEEFADGDTSALDHIANTLEQSERALRDAQALQDAAKQVAQADENLGGDAPSTPNSRDEHGGDGENGDSDAMWGANGALGDADDMVSGARGGTGEASNAGAEDAPDRAPSTRQLDSVNTPVTLKPEGQFGEGDTFTSQATVMPNANTASMSFTNIAPEFTAQLEDALSKDAYKLADQELIRNYFLRLSEAAKEPAKAASPDHNQ